MEKFGVTPKMVGEAATTLAEKMEGDSSVLSAVVTDEDDNVVFTIVLAKGIPEASIINEIVEVTVKSWDHGELDGSFAGRSLKASVPRG